MPAATAGQTAQPGDITRDLTDTLAEIGAVLPDLPAELRREVEGELRALALVVSALARRIAQATPGQPA
jgi:hypothetical protein